MDESKIFKDPIYGYIEIPNLLIKNVIDTPVFQRLRRIVQTSYAPLYATALHNRFTHSLGVYHLGRIAIDTIIEKATDNEKNSLKKYRDIFLLACLLHDVGHAPFSHIGEIFYLKEEDDYSEIHALLEETVNDNKFSLDILSSKSEFAAPHEIMSVIVGLKQFEKLCIDSGKPVFSTSENRSFFARCITGYVYTGTEITTEMEILNCLISLLNSSLIDVDKLDYLMRDAYMLGFNSVSIDYKRLLSALQILTNNDEIMELVYNKNAISVIENVVYARDAEKRWIQMHPAVLYEMHLLKGAMKQLKSCITEDSNLFSYKALTQEGVSFRFQPLNDTELASDANTSINDNEYKIRLLSDDDIVYLLKNKFPNRYFDKFMDRNLRRHPLWKTEAEYKAFFLIEMGNSSSGKNFETAMNSLAIYMKQNGIDYIDQGLLEKIEKEIKEINNLKTYEDIYNQSIKISLADKRKIKAILTGLKSFSKENDIEFNYILIQKDQFVSSFDKDNFSKIKIAFSCGNKKPKIVDFGNVALSVTAQKNESNKTDSSFYHLFYKRSDNNSFDIEKLEREWENSLRDNN